MTDEPREEDLPPGTAIGEESVDDEETLSEDELELQEQQRGKGYGARPD